MILSLIILVVGFVLLVKGADFFVEGAAAVARKLMIPTFIIGMTIVAMGTSAPECAVSITASLRGSNGMAISNVIGSNIFNMLVVCGACSLFAPLTIKKKTMVREFPVSILAGVALGIMGFLGWMVGRVDGIILLACFVVFLIWMVGNAKKAMAKKKAGMENADEDLPEEEEIKDLPIWKCLIFIAGGMVAIILGGQMVVNAGESLARAFGLSETLIGLTVCSIGTSLPELVTSISAARKNQVDMALGNVLGSNIFNIMLVAGLASSISPVMMIQNNLIDIIILTVLSVYMLVIVWKKQRLSKLGGISLLLIYVAYMVYICMRDTGAL